MSDRKQLIEDLNINKVILSKKMTGTFISKVSCNSDYNDSCNYIYVSFSKKDLERLFRLKAALENLKAEDVISISIYDNSYVFIGMEYEKELGCDILEEVFDEDDDKVIIEYAWLSIQPMAKMEDYNIREESGHLEVSSYGISFIAFEKHSGMMFSSDSMSWELLEKLYKDMEGKNGS